MQNTMPLVSVILPVCNCSKHLALCLKSLVFQTYKNIEIIAIDDKSTDNSFGVIKQFAQKDKRIKLSKNKKRYGLSVCLNRALKKAKGTLITFMNPHDTNRPERIQKQVEYLLANQKTVAVGTQCTILNENDKKIEKTSFPQDHEGIYSKLIVGSAMQFETIMINRLLLPKDLLYFKAQPYPIIFKDIFLKLIQYGQLSNLAGHLYNFRQRHFMKHQQKTVKKAFHNAKLLLKSITEYEYRPSLRSILPPLVNS